jgi:hypothetical protein
VAATWPPGYEVLQLQLLPVEEVRKCGAARSRMQCVNTSILHPDVWLKSCGGHTPQGTGYPCLSSTNAMNAYDDIECMLCLGFTPFPSFLQPLPAIYFVLEFCLKTGFFLLYCGSLCHVARFARPSHFNVTKCNHHYHSTPCYTISRSPVSTTPLKDYLFLCLHSTNLDKQGL